MHYFWLISGVILALVWLDRLRDAVHGREIADISAREWDRRDVALPKLSIIVPARNEGLHVEAALRSMLALDYPDFEVIAIDDRSTDNTAAVLDEVATGFLAGSAGAGASPASLAATAEATSPKPSLEVVHIQDLPPGWLGKPHAMFIGGQHASGDWLLFTDADVRFRADALRRAITYAEAAGADHLVVFPTHELHSIGERMMFACFSMLFVFGHRPWRVHDPRARDFLGFGPFNLIRRSVYEQIGTAEKLRMEVIEDMKLGKLVKDHGFSQRVAHAPGLIPWRWFHGTFGIIRNLKKNLFAGMNYRYEKAFGACLLFGFLAILPYAGLLLARGWLRLPFAIAVVAIFLLYVGMSRRSPVSPFYFILHPVGSALLIYAMFVSIAHAARHRGVVWRGTRYPIEELRKGLV
ncbi:MAG TPA: glycosyltransferase [Terriglobales bacterium]|nr:glycosyltransferase [Terriglobales bacterium]